MAGKTFKTDLFAFDHNQMEEDYNNPELNSYDTGPGSRFRQNKPKDGGNTKLHVSNIPHGLTEDGLRNIFSCEGDIPEAVYIHKKPNQQLITSWGFVTFKNVAAAHSAMTAINRQPPYHFNVTFARCNEDDRSDSSKERKSLDGMQLSDKSSRESITPSSRGRGKLPPMQGQPPSSFRALRSNDESYIDDLGEDYSFRRFSHCGTTFEQNASNSVISPFAEGEYDDGKRKMIMGRGSFIASRTSLSVEKIQEREDQDMEHKVAAYFGNQTKNFLFDNDAIISSETKLSLPVKPGNCTYCSRPSIYICSKCKCWYCTNYCRKKHWSVHKSACFPRLLEFQNGIAVYKLMSETSCSENINKRIGKDPGENHRNINNFDSKHKGNNGIAIESNKTTFTSESFSGNFYNKKKSLDNCKSGRDHFKGGNGNVEGKHKGGFDKKVLQRCYKSVESDVHVKAPPPVLDRDKPLNLDNSPIPADVFTKVTIGALGKDGEFYAYKIDDYLKQGNMMVKLNEYCCKAGSSNFKIEEGAKCIAPFEGDWYRAEVVQIFSENVKVKFIDFGNESDVIKSELKMLPEHLTIEPPMAHRFLLASSANNPTLEQESTLAIKPVSQDMHGRWIVHAEGTNYSNTYEKIAISVTESKDVYWVHKNENLFTLICMTSNLGEHKDVVVDEPLVGEIYVHFYNNSWCRGKVISKNPLKLEYIDYGNHNVVNKNELHPVPKKYKEMPPLAFKIKLVEGTSADYQNLKPMSKLFIKEVKKLEDGTTVCHVQGNDCPTNRQVNHFLHLLQNDGFACIQIEKIMNDEFLTGTIMDSDRIPVYQELSKVIGGEVVLENDMKMTPGMNLAAKWKNDWYRGYLMMLREYSPIVALIDKGKVVIPEDVAPIPKKVLNVPGSGVRVIFDKPFHNKKLVGETVSVKNIKHDYKNNYVQGDIDGFGSVIMLPWVPALEEAGLDCIQIPSGSKVQIASYHSPSAVYVQSCDPKYKTMLSELVQDVAAYITDENLKRKPLIGEFLACQYIEDGYYYRAQVFRRDGDKYKVNFVDYGNTEVVSQEDMRQLPEHLKRVPCCAVKVGLKDVPNVPFNTQCMKFLNELAANTIEMFLTYEKDLQEVTLELREGDIVNKVLLSFLEPSWNKPDYNHLRSHIFMGTEIKYETWTKGSKFMMTVASVIRHDKVLALRPESGLLNHLEYTLTPMITAYCESKPNEPYNPRRSEVCLAKFHEDQKWYRAICLKSYQHNASEVFYFDYGNSGEVLHRCIRKMVPEFMEPPAVLKLCKIYGLPEKVPESLISKLKEYLSTLKTEAEVLEEVDGNSVLWIPALGSHASQLGITIKYPSSS